MSEIERWWRLVWRLGLVPLGDVPQPLRKEFMKDLDLSGMMDLLGVDPDLLGGLR